MAKYESRHFLNFIGFLATVLIAAAVLIAGIVQWVGSGTFGWNLPGLTFSGVPNILMCIANICAYILAVIAGFAYAKSRRNLAYMIIQIVALVIICIVVIISIF